ncbi:hypothetical protein HNQ04_001191 [Deinococcus radiopugnans ATCC 19172]|uniref:Uncharacterized protein n=1 Tax=Deinococcus radiopugnans ATCC 19172 TaxID=585398 RepID=A0ABR6NPK2_9DEIO|nr:hypothetical protein [Deinococcus radiopugnans ATCC 19172]
MQHGDTPLRTLDTSHRDDRLELLIGAVAASTATKEEIVGQVIRIIMDDSLDDVEMIKNLINND